MTTFNIHHAKTHLSRLIKRALNGEEIIIAHAGKPVARISKYGPERKEPRKFGQWEGKVWMSDDFDAPLPPEIERAFLGEGT